MKGSGVDTSSKEFKPTRGWRMLVAAVLAVTFLGIDQVTKAIVRATLARAAAGITVIPGILGFEYVENTGVAFGLASGYGYSFVLLAAVVVVVAIVYLLRAPLISRLEVVGLGMLAGGAIGNAYDRLVHGFVTDFIATQFVNFPVFNVADIGITVGVVIAFVGFLFSPANAEAKRRAEEDRARRLGRSADKADDRESGHKGR